MAVIKVACPRCGQKVSGDDSFFGTSVECPVCTSQIEFPQNPNAPSSPPPNDPPLPSVGDEIASADRPPGTPGPDPSAPPEYVKPELPQEGDDLVDVPRRVSSSPPAENSEPAEYNDLPKADADPSGWDDEPIPSEESESQSQSSSESADESPSLPESPRVRRGSDHDHDDVPSPALGATSLVLGILSIVSCLFTAIITAPGAVICGHIALAKAKHSPVKPVPGRTLALIGTILGYVSLVLLILALILGPIIKRMIEANAPGGV